MRSAERSTITSLSIKAATPSRFVRIAKLSHAGQGSTLEYTIRQTTHLRRGRVVRQVNELLEDHG
jgi:hypothetical protein